MLLQEVRSKMNAEFDTVEDALKAIAAGEMIVVADDDDRENEGDLIMAASKDSEAVAFMIRHTSGILCAPCSKSKRVVCIWIRWWREMMRR